MPVLPPGLGYVSISAGEAYSLLRRSDGKPIAFGQNTYSKCNVPKLPAGTSCVELAPGARLREVIPAAEAVA